MNARHRPCGEPLVTGGECAFDASNCPVHPVRESPATETAGPEPATPAGRKEQSPDLRVVARDALVAVGRDNASPTYTARFLNSIKSADALGPVPEEEELRWRVSALMGGIMHGMPPRDRRQWDLLEEQGFDEMTLRDIVAWSSGHPRADEVDFETPLSELIERCKVQCDERDSRRDHLAYQYPEEGAD